MNTEISEAIAEYAARGFVPVDVTGTYGPNPTVTHMREEGKDPYSALHVAIWVKDGELQVEEY